MPWSAPGDDLPARPTRILVAGTSGSGKSTLGRAIAAVLGIDYFEIDALYHGPGWTPKADFVREVERRTAGPAWVTEWQYGTVRDLLADQADLMVWLDLPRLFVMRSVIMRTMRRSLRGIELWNGNYEPPLRSIIRDRDHIIRWAWRTHAESAARVRECVDRRPALNAVALSSRKEAQRWLDGPLAHSAHHA